MLDTVLFHVGEAPVTLAGLLTFLGVLIGTYIVARLARSGIVRVNRKRSPMSRAGIYTLSRLLFYFIIIIGFTIASSIIGIDFTTFALIAGALSVGIGFGLQSIINNFVSGILLLVEKKIRPGDVIELDGGTMGRVLEINVRTTLLRTFNNLEVIVPNSELVVKKCTNWTLSDLEQRIKIPFQVSGGVDRERLREIVLETAKRVSTTSPNHEVELALTRFSPSTLEYELIVWVDEGEEGPHATETHSLYLDALESAFRQNNIS